MLSLISSNSYTLLLCLPHYRVLILRNENKQKTEASDYGVTKKHFTRRPSFPRHITL